MILNKDNNDSKGYIFDIQGLSVHDGPGCRTLIFFCGCTLNCFWCSNPEGISTNPSLLYAAEKCIVCGKCMGNCAEKALSMERGVLEIQRQFCDQCTTHGCLNECYTDALRLSGYEISVEKLVEIIRRDRQYWGREGGITLTGGEPLLQLGFVKNVLAKCHESYIHTAAETCGNVPWRNFQEVIPSLDWIFFDLKHPVNSQHQKATGAGNSLILENAKRLSEAFKGRLIFRLPLIPGFNDSEEHIAEVIALIRETGRNEINILPLHHLGREKYRLLQKEYPASGFLPPTNEKLKEIGELFRASGITCYLGSSTPF
jgi:glycyl-radical enzyme activating protein